MYSLYTVTKATNELYAGVFEKCYGMETIGLRYFNVFGKRQDPNGAYAAVMPKWIAQVLNDEDVYINGDGETSRNFTYIDGIIKVMDNLTKPNKEWNTNDPEISSSSAPYKIYNIKNGPYCLLCAS